jgi:hypothetical protein
MPKLLYPTSTVYQPKRAEVFIGSSRMAIKKPHIKRGFERTVFEGCLFAGYK